MAFNINLFNAAVVGENAEEGFIVENGRLHAVDVQVAALKKEKSNPKQIIPVLKDALTALIKYAEGKIPEHFLDVKSIQNNEEAQLIEKIVQIYIHLPHTDRNNLSSLIHHKSVS